MIGVGGQESQIIKKGNVVFDNVTAAYPGTLTKVLKNLKFTIYPTEKIGIVGRTGSGKTSLIKLFWRCLDLQSGTITIDGKDITKCDLKRLRKEMDVVAQETALFKGSLRMN